MVPIRSRNHYNFGEPDIFISGTRVEFHRSAALHFNGEPDCF